MLHLFGRQFRAYIPRFTVMGLFFISVCCSDAINDPQVVLEQVIIETSDQVIDCDGEWFNEGKPTNLIIRSKKINGTWVQTKNITIRNCKIKGAIRIMGLGVNGEAEGVRQSSISLGHTERAQQAAPTNITFSDVTVEGIARIPMYLSPGTTYVTVENCTFTGTSVSITVYMDAESGHNIFRNNTFETIGDREVIAVDGSANNLIEGNKFEYTKKGGIYLYRNCGEGGTVRHQTPRYNKILNNTFNLKSLSWGNYGIWLASRNGNRSYCDKDAVYDFGSSIDNRDYADFNAVESNIFTGKSGMMVEIILSVFFLL